MSDSDAFWTAGIIALVAIALMAANRPIGRINEVVLSIFAPRHRGIPEPRRFYLGPVLVGAFWLLLAVFLTVSTLVADG